MISIFSVRAAREEDLADILSLDRATPDAPHWSEAMYREYVVPQVAAVQRRSMYVAVLDGMLGGFAAASALGEEAELESIAVAAAVRRAGIGSRLLADVSAWARHGGAQILRLEVRSANEEATAFYAAHDFTREGMRKAYYTEPVDDAVLLRRHLIQPQS